MPSHQMPSPHSQLLLWACGPCQCCVRVHECVIWQFKQLVHACPCPSIPGRSHSAGGHDLRSIPGAQDTDCIQEQRTPNFHPRKSVPPQAPAPKTSDSIKLFEFRTPEVTPMWGACVGSEARHLIDCKLLLTSFRMLMVVGSCASIVA